MPAAPAVVFLIAKLLLLGPEGTTVVSEHQAHVPLDGIGLLRETIVKPGFPEAIALYMTPSRSTAPDEAAGGEGDLIVKVRADLWSHAADERAGGKPDEENSDEMVLSAGGAILQIAENPATGHRLILSLSSPPEQPSPEAALPEPPKDPIQISFLLEAFESQAGRRQPVASQTLRTFDGREVSWRFSWKRPVVPEEGGAPVYRDEGVTLTLTPISRSEGWISVEARLEASVSPGEDDKKNVDLVSSETKTVALGIPFEISLTPPDSGEDGAAAGTKGKGPAKPPPRYVVEITPYILTGR